MAIQWNHDTNPPKPTYAGCVVRVELETNVQVMSDVWADFMYAVVWDGERLTRVYLGGDVWVEGRATVDATPEVLAQVAVWEEEQRQASLAAADAAAVKMAAAAAAAEIEVAKAQALAVDKGKRVRTVARRGRNAPPLGTEGVVFWCGFSPFGVSRVGLKTDDGTIWWTTAGNCEAILPGVAAGQEPAGGWVAYMAAVHEAERKAAAALPQVGDRVLMRATGVMLQVFWAKGHRLGLKVNRRDPNGSPVWADADEVVVLRGHVVSANPTSVGALHAPFCDIRWFVQDSGENYSALDAEGTVVAVIPPATVLELT